VLQVLVVDADPEGAKLASRAVQLALFGQHFKLKVARSSAEALAVTRRWAPDLIVVSHDVPELGGLQLLERFLALGWEGTEIVVSGCELDDASQQRYAEAGASALVGKPVEIDPIIDTIAAVAEQAGW